MGGVAVKVCGLMTLADAEAALGFGADYVGFVLYAGSRRGISVDVLRSIAGGLGARGRGRMVGVFVNEAPGRVAEIAGACGLAAAQIHGDEPADGFGALPVEVWRALRVGAGGCEPDPEAWPASRYVLDARAPGVYGGSGQRADWGLAERLARGRECFLAGGLTPENVEEAIRSVRPWGVDVSGGVEAAPGRKDADKVRRFVERARGVG